MAYIRVPEDMPGIRGLFAFRPETAFYLNQLAEALLQGPSTLTKGERELIAMRVSCLNECRYCAGTHGAVAKHHLQDAHLVKQVADDPEEADLSTKMKALIRIADKVQISGRDVSKKDISEAREEGATDREIHDTVLIASAFSMFNRYVDGLGTEAPDKEEVYDQIGAYRAINGYLAPNNQLKRDK